MPSNEHQWLVLWVARKMVADGVLVTGFDGPTPQGGVFNELPKPGHIGPFRPDVSGILGGAGVAAFGEAKTEGDIGNSHTIAQLRAFASSSGSCVLYLAVPRSAAFRLDQILAKAALPRSARLIRMYVPDCLVREVADDYA